MENISNPMFKYQYGDIELDNIIQHDRFTYPDEQLPKMSLTEFVTKLKNQEDIEAGTFVYMTMLHLIEENCTSSEEVLTHIPTSAKLVLESEEDNDDWTRAFLIIDDKKIWIGDEVDGSFHDMTAKYGDTNSFEFKTFQEYS